MMRGLKGLLALLLVIVLAIISFCMPCPSSALDQQDATEKKASENNDFSFSFPLSTQAPPGFFSIRVSLLWFLQRSIMLWRLVVLLMICFIVLSRQRLLCYYSSSLLKMEFSSIFMASCHIFRAPPVPV